MHIAVYAIAKNEGAHVGRWLESIADADEIVVVDTGSTDDTVAQLRSQDVRVTDARLQPWRFDVARNMALALVSPGADACLTLDLDEVMSPGWRQAIERAWTPDHQRLSFRFVAGHLPDGSPSTAFMRDLCHARWGFLWRYPIHECLTSAGATGAWTVAEGLECHHWPDLAKPRGNYLPLLRVAAAEQPHDARMAYYLARELAWCATADEAIPEYLRYLSLPTSTYPAERAEAMRQLARLQPAAAESWLHKAIAEDAERRDQWVDLAELYYRREAWAAGLGAAMAALKITERFGRFMSFAEAWGSRPHDLASICAWHVGARDLARDQLRLAIAAAEPQDLPRLEANAQHMGVEVPHADHA